MGTLLAVGGGVAGAAYLATKNGGGEPILGSLFFIVMVFIVLPISLYLVHRDRL